VLFNSTQFLVFLAIVLPLYYALAHRWQNVMLLVASYVFYGCWDWRFLSLLAISTIVDFTCALLIHRTPEPLKRKRLLLVTLCLNLGFLGFFKYFGFFADSFAELMALFGVHASVPTLRIVLPVGISFYTFQSISYTIDVYYRRAEPTTDFIAFALYVSYFPHLVAGPIQRATHLLPQMQAPRRVDQTGIATACQLMLMGYFKKVFIADGVAPYVDQAFAQPRAMGSPQLLLSLYLFAIQIYGDFSGYTDIARGVSRLLGIELTLNFKQPYLAANITEFWRRWHIALSSFLRDYLYIPLGGNRHGTAMTHRNLLLTMLLGGLWHGASWNFVAWGGLHGLYLSAHRMMSEGRRVESSRVPRGLFEWVVYVIKVVVTFHVVCLAWIFFRAKDFRGAWTYLLGLVQNWRPCPTAFLVCAGCYMLMALLVDLACWQYDQELPALDTWPAWRRGLVYAAMMVLISFVGELNARPFIYFQF
jgi:D-alanyl-lipoteichoic acid acyltransferase DltB (MBOAT superfamily)